MNDNARARVTVRILALLLGVCALGSSPAYAWDELGHRVIARIAWDGMTPAVRARAIELLQSAPPGSGIAALRPQTGTEEERMREWFAHAAVWPDLIRSRAHPGSVYAQSDWHYVNFFWEPGPHGPIDRPDVPRAGQLIDQVQRISRTLPDPSVPDSSKAVDLAWLLHLVGDGHQPLHNNARITPEDPEGDRGGNSFRLAGLYPYNNLHAYWDALVGPAFPWRPGERTEAEYVGRIAREIAARHPRSRLQGRVLPGEVETWSREGVRVAQRVGYPSWLRRGERAPQRYRPHAWRAAEPRIALAGYRLAELLNRTLGV
ncbi:MAG: S1/P1 nuclease [Gemmatimonadota bacterium]|jgi:hypothetical protein|nr:S1/P1 nuclease [Gemmatimonadota bacterium]